MGVSQFCEHNYRLLAVLTLGIALFNLGFRIDREVVTPWDEALYATSAAEMARSGNWLVTTYDGEPDYYNAKPPLNVWLITAAVKAGGMNLVALRLPSLLGAFAAIVVLQFWSRRVFGAAAALLSTLVLSTTFSFLYVHSARSANPDALLALTILLTVVTLWASRVHPWRLVWLGPIVAAAFLLKGAAVMLPILIVIGTLAWNRAGRQTLAPLAVASTLGAVPALAWAVARWRVDGDAFFRTLIGYDAFAGSTSALEGHVGSWMFYPYQIQKDQYDWLIAGLAGVLLLLAAGQLRRWWTIEPWTRRLLVVWAVVTIGVPTLMSTKLPWYVNSFYPLLAVGVAAVVVAAWEQMTRLDAKWERRLLAAIVVSAFGLAEGKLIWYSYNQRDLGNSVQGLVLSRRADLAGGVVAQRVEWDPADRFVVQHLVGATPLVAPRRRSPEARDGWWIRPATSTEPLTLVSPNGGQHVARRHRHRHLDRVLNATRGFLTGSSRRRESPGP